VRKYFLPAEQTHISVVFPASPGMRSEWEKGDDFQGAGLVIASVENVALMV
jgi:hypothetical protein